MTGLKRTSVLTLLIGMITATDIAMADNELKLAAAPRGSRDKEEANYKPIAEHLSKVLNRKVVYVFTDNWLTYQSDMRKGQYDIVFDGPAFVAWRMEKLNHVPIVKFPGQLSFVVAVRKDNTKVNDVKDLIGRTLCGFAPPNLATLVVQAEFDNPVRQPMLIEIGDFRTAYDNVVRGKCVGGIMQTKLHENYDKEAGHTKVVFRSKPLPNQAFSTGARINAEMRQKIADGLLSPAGQAAMQKLLDSFKVKELQRASIEEYVGLDRFLQHSWGFNR